MPCLGSTELHTTKTALLGSGRSALYSSSNRKGIASMHIHNLHGLNRTGCPDSISWHSGRPLTFAALTPLRHTSPKRAFIDFSTTLSQVSAPFNSQQVQSTKTDPAPVQPPFSPALLKRALCNRLRPAFASHCFCFSIQKREDSLLFRLLDSFWSCYAHSYPARALYYLLRWGRK